VRWELQTLDKPSLSLRFTTIIKGYVVKCVPHPIFLEENTVEALIKLEIMDVPVQKVS
jgi:hypothetical protein